MQHVDEGRIQAWLDRERSGIDAAEHDAIQRHLAECAACARKAEELEGIDLRSTDILSAARVDGDAVPDFEAIRERARRLDRTPRRFAAGRAGAWAASLIAAVGLGWAMNDLLERGTVSEPPGQPAAAMAPQVELAPPREMAENASGMPARESEQPVVADLMAERDAAASPAEAVAPDVRQESVSVAQSEDRVAALPAPTEPVPNVSDPAVASRQEVSRFAVPTAAARSDALADRALAGEATGGGRAVLGKVVDADGSPIQAAQVFVEGTDVGSLTTPDGSFLMHLETSAIPADDARLVVQHIGHRQEDRRLGPWVGDTLAVQFELAEVPLALEEVLVTAARSDVDRAQPAPAPEAPVPGAVAAEPAAVGASAEVTVADIGWSRASQSDAEAAAGFSIARLPERPVDLVEMVSADGITALRVTQTLADGTPVTLVQSRAELVVGPDVLPTTHRVAYGNRDELRIAIIGPLPVERLLGVLERVR